jgi:tetratricopeptide (TPR) repeat protein
MNRRLGFAASVLIGIVIVLLPARAGVAWPPGGYGPYRGWPNYYGYAYYNRPPVYSFGSGLGIYNGVVGFSSPYRAAGELISPTQQFLVQAREAFRNKDYREAVRLASHAAVETPDDLAAHELISLGLFAVGDYREAATEARAAIAIGPPSNWATLYSYYGDIRPYTAHLRALEHYVLDHPTMSDTHFLVAYYYLVMGYREAAKNSSSRPRRLPAIK